VQDSADGAELQTVQSVALDGADGSTLGDLSPVDFSEIERDLQRAVRPAAESAG